MWNSYLLIFLMPMACIQLNPNYAPEPFLLPDDTCVNALAEYERCDWSRICRKALRRNYPESWSPAKVTYEQCYLGSPRCGALEEGCEAL